MEPCPPPDWPAAGGAPLGLSSLLGAVPPLPATAPEPASASSSAAATSIARRTPLRRGRSCVSSSCTKRSFRWAVAAETLGGLVPATAAPRGGNRSGRTVSVILGCAPSGGDKDLYTQIYSRPARCATLRQTPCTWLALAAVQHGRHAPQ